MRTLWKPLTAGGLILLALCWFSHARYESGYQAADSSWKLKDEKRQKANALALASKQADERSKEKERRDAADKAAAEADTQLAKARADAADAERTGDQLRATISAIRKQFAASETGRLSAVAAASSARANTGILLANVLESADKRAGELAEYADRARIAGQTCEKIYNQVTKGNQQ
ncbi:MAG TPA: DUF2514 family protein [Scandinavium sp.]|jgi:hypothetical protein